MHCPQCGTEILPGKSFCMGCGFNVGGGQQAGQLQQPPPQAPQYQQQGPPQQQWGGQYAPVQPSPTATFAETGKIAFKYFVWDIWHDLLSRAKENVMGLELGDEYPVMSLVSVIHLYLCRFLFYIALGLAGLAVVGSVITMVVAFIANSFGLLTLLTVAAYIVAALVEYFLVNFLWAATLMYQDFFKVLVKIKEEVSKQNQ